jgi:hypothetical protein
VRSKVWLISLLLVASCARPVPLSAATIPEDAGVRRDAVDQLARNLFEAMRSGQLSKILASSRTLDELMVPQARLRLEGERQQLFSSAVELRWAAWTRANYAGFCAQDADGGNGGTAGLRRPGWVLSRVLVVADDGGGPSAAWAQGTFVYTTAGFAALSLASVEPIRARHADLDLAPCDVERGIH